MLPCFSGDVILDITARIKGMEHIPTEPINAPGNITIDLVSVSAYLNAEHMYRQKTIFKIKFQDRIKFFI